MEWEETGHNSSQRSPDIFDVIYNELASDKTKHSDLLMDQVLTPLKQAMVERVMKEFWVIFNQEWSVSVRKCAAAPTSTSSPASSSSAKPTSTETGQRASTNKEKRPRQGDENHNSDEEDEEDSKRPKKSSLCPPERKGIAKFACPYRKYNPQRYCIRNWRVCALTGLDNVARVKFVPFVYPIRSQLTTHRGHLYRHHRVFQCQRCKEIFQNQEDLDGHFVGVKSCELVCIEPAEGITSALEKQLRCRKKTHPGQTEEERWKQIYGILFPHEPVPASACKFSNSLRK